MKVERMESDWTAVFVTVEETDAMPSWFYLSFADPGRPKGTQFLGGAYVEAESLAEAVTRSHTLGINPGGEIKGIGPLPPEAVQEHVLPEDRNRLLTLAELGDVERGE